VKPIKYISLFLVINSFLACNNIAKKNAFTADKKDTATSCMMVPARFANTSVDSALQFNGDTSVKGMVFIKGGTFMMGGDNSLAGVDEYPKHKVEVSSFWMDATEVTNAQFQKFVNATHYITTAEKKPDWDEMKQTLPPGTPKPPDSMLVAASLVFHQTSGPVNMNDYGQWWKWVKGADWKHPEGPTVILKEKIIILLCKLAGTMQWLIASGQASVCQQKQNGNMQQEADCKTIFTPGEMNLPTRANPKLIRGVESFLITMMIKMGLWV